MSTTRPAAGEDLGAALEYELSAARETLPPATPGDALSGTRDALAAMGRLLPAGVRWRDVSAAQRAEIDLELTAALTTLPPATPGDALSGTRDALAAMRRLLPRQPTPRGTGRALLRSRSELQEALDVLPRGREWTLDNVKWDRDRSVQRYVASHPICGVLGAYSGPELLAAVTGVEDRREEMEAVGLVLWRGNLLSATASWWASERQGLRATGVWASDLYDLVVLVQERTRREQPRAAQRGKPFAYRVLEAARSVPKSGWFGRQKVFLSRVYEAMRADYPERAAWDVELVECNRLGLLTLTRADLVSTMDPTLVRESEVTHYGAAYHFVVVDE